MNFMIKIKFRTYSTLSYIQKRKKKIHLAFFIILFLLYYIVYILFYFIYFFNENIVYVKACKNDWVCIGNILLYIYIYIYILICHVSFSLNVPIQ